MNDEVIFEKSGHRADVCFNRPHQHNAMRFSMYERLEEICEQLDADDEIRVAVFRGAGGKAFVAGTDIGQFRGFKTGDDAIAYEARIDRVVGRLERLRCTTVAMVQGVCAGGGVPIALACDFRYADDDLRLGVPIAKTLGNCLSMANVARMIDFVGVAKTKEILMLGKMIGAQEAKAAGVVNDVFAAEDLEQKTDALVADILALAPLTLRAVKTAVRRTLDARRASSELGEDFIRLCYTSEDFHGAVDAFMEKHRYAWQGR
ncbi:enoyl-CoA hydratase [Castellaniella sp. S9]|uniref:enoyl-CoA hydratase n=1 Tax=Castellaniella sp. S9 TaxID=2993652 RepID=UPI0022B2F668|nr:enoyl-CoA hydratase [Castellaniella sp. S9]